MPNVFKYSPGATASGVVYKGGFLIGNNTADYGSTYYTGLTPGASGYTVYLNKVSAGPSIYSVESDAALVQLTNTQIVGNPNSAPTYSTAQQCLSYFATQSDKLAANRDYEPIVTPGMVINIDGGFTPSFPATGSTWYDIGPNGLNVSLLNGPTYSSEGGGSVLFDGTDDRGTQSSALLNVASNPFTIEFAAKTGSTSVNYGKMLSKGRWSQEGWLVFFGQYLGNYSIGLETYNGASVLGCTAVASASVNTWYHVAFVKDSTNLLTSYVYGSFGFTGPTFSNLSSSQTWSVALGNSAEYFKGNISFIRQYNRALSSSEISQNYYAFLNGRLIVTSGLVLNLQAGNPLSYPGTGTAWYDVSGSKNNGTLINGPTYSGASGGSIVFDGTDDYVNLGSTSVTNVTNNFSFNVFFSTSNISRSDQTIFSKAESGAYGLEFNTTFFGSNLGFLAYINGQYRSVSEPINIYSSNTYYCITITYDNSSLKLYRDGVLRTSTSISGNVTTTTQPLCLGINPQASGPYVFPFLGRIPSFQIYNRALTAAEVLQNYNALKGAYGL